MDTQKYVLLILMIVFAGMLLYQKTKRHEALADLEIMKELYELEILKRQCLGYRSMEISGDVMEGIYFANDRWARIYNQYNQKSLFYSGLVKREKIKL